MTDSKRTNSNGDIDIIVLFTTFFSWLGEIFKDLFQGLNKILLFFVRYFLLFFISAIIALVISLFKKNSQEEQFESTMTVKSNTVPVQEMISFVNKLHFYCFEGNYESLKSALGSSMSVEEIIDIEAFWLYDRNKDGIFDGVDYQNKFLGDSNIYKSREKLAIRTIVTNPLLLEDLSEVLHNYIANNDYFKSSNDFRIEFLSNFVNQYDLEIEKLDSLQKREYYQDDNKLKSEEGQLIFATELETKLYHDEVFKLLREKNFQMQELTIHKGVITIIEDFSMSRKPSNSLTSYFYALIPWLICLSLIVALLLEFRKQIVKFIKRS